MNHSLSNRTVDSGESDQQMVERKGFRFTLRRVLTVWFLLLALLPLTLVAFISYQQAHSSLTLLATEKLERSSELTVNFIKNWFNYRFMDLANQAQVENNTKLLQQLIEGLENSGKGLAEYVGSDDWAQRVEGAQNDLITLTRHYDYLYDLFLIDRKGNILYTVVREPELGTNLFSGPYAGTRFASSVRTTLETGRINFSDLEYYAPANDLLSGYLTAPLLDEFGDPLGVFAMQIRFDRVASLLLNQKSQYLVGKDGILRSAINGNQQEVLNRRISTEQFHRYLNAGKERNRKTDHSRQTASSYTGPEGQQVIGLHQTISLPGADWMLVSEINESEALALANWLGQLTVMLVALMAVMATGLALFLSRRITRPIIQLADIAMAVAAGETDQQVAVETKNEIGWLAEAFNHMLSMRKLHEKALEYSTQGALHALSELAEQRFALDQHAIVAITDVRGTITYVNDKFIEISGYNRRELLGQNHRILNSGYHDTEFFRCMYKTIAKGEVWHGEICNKAKDGRLYWMDSTIVPFKGDGDKPKSYIAIRTDITKRKNAEMALIDAKNAAEAATLAKSEFLASMSHEIRTPMNGVLGMLELLLQTGLDEEQRHQASLAQSSARSLLILINDILDFSKIEAGKLDLEELDFDLSGLLGDFVDDMALRAQKKGLELVLDVTGIEHSRIKGDPGRIRQILNNLVSNAIKFTSSGEIVIRANLIEPDSGGMVFHCTITDTGIGIPEEKLTTLFDSFTQVDASTTRKFGGSGLGLAIVKKLCELMDGRVSVSSEIGKGSCFEFTLMLRASQQSQLVMPQINTEELRLLIVDDNATNREVLRRQLEHWGARVEEAADGPSALALCEASVRQPQTPENRLFDVAFLDMQIPGMDGAELGKAMKADARFNAIRLVMMTSIAHRGDARFFADLGFSAYFPKPATTSDLFDALSVVVEGGKALQQASPLVTRHYLKSLAYQDSDITQQIAEIDVDWPANARLLLVEDNSVNQFVAKGILNNLGLSADLAADGREALYALREAPADHPYTLVFMDCQMPGMDGYEASRKIRTGLAGSRNRDIPIIAMTANAMRGDKEKCLAAGMSDYMSKPIDANHVKIMLCKWLLGMTESSLATLKSSVQSGQHLDETDQADISEKKETAAWDKAAALKRIGGNEQILNQTIKLFIDDMPAQIDAIQHQVREERTAEVAKLAHAIKGVAANASGLRLHQVSAEMETAAKGEGPARLKQLLPDLLAAYQQLSEIFIQQLAEGKPQAGGSVLSAGEIDAILQQLAKQLRRGDYIAPEDYEPLAAGSANGTGQALIQRLLEQLGALDADGALHSIGEIRSRLNPNAVVAEDD